jgi:hypothetical protein
MQHSSTRDVDWQCSKYLLASCARGRLQLNAEGGSVGSQGDQFLLLSVACSMSVVWTLNDKFHLVIEEVLLPERLVHFVDSHPFQNLAAA